MLIYRHSDVVDGAVAGAPIAPLQLDEIDG